jgi:hypothetical protein
MTTAAPALAAVAQRVQGEDQIYLLIALLSIFALAGICTWVVSKVIDL